MEKKPMEYVTIGRSGLEVSRICVGCMGFGDSERWLHKWVINEELSHEVIRHALEQGINFFDTANIYALGTSEEYVGNALKKFAKRDDVVLATKVHGRMKDGPNGGGLSRKAILSEVDNSLRRLKTDYIDLYQIHRWDYGTPIEETMEALNDVVRSGRVRYIGASAMYAWQFQKALFVSEKHGWAKFISMQNHLNLIYREEEREMLPLCADAGIGVIPYSPMASGKLTRAWTDDSSNRASTDPILRMKYGSSADIDAPVLQRVGEVAERLGIPRSHVALAWLIQKPQVAAPIFGPTTIAHIDNAIGAIDVKLPAAEITYLEELYVPHKVVGAL
jgi:aryl-alcohol dehydrogenase-like predicted oxidoreductase